MLWLVASVCMGLYNHNLPQNQVDGKSVLWGYHTFLKEEVNHHRLIIWKYNLSRTTCDMCDDRFKTLSRGGGGSIGALPFTFDTIHPLDMIFGTYNELPLYFQLSITMWRSTGFHGKYCYDVKSGRHLGSLSFQILFKFELKTENGEKTAFSDWNLQIS